ncbi:hypothetical protein F5Y19DRAFT_471951 [Xylariaceae sp. FL1651]|nr:hypothetical protein F5Y19DRAFT_471951 [Xylariaceae sp. FL1651]
MDTCRANSGFITRNSVERSYIQFEQFNQINATFAHALLEAFKDALYSETPHSNRQNTRDLKRTPYVERSACSQTRDAENLARVPPHLQFRQCSRGTSFSSISQARQARRLDTLDLPRGYDRRGLLPAESARRCRRRGGWSADLPGHVCRPALLSPAALFNSPPPRPKKLVRSHSPLDMGWMYRSNYLRVAAAFAEMRALMDAASCAAPYASSSAFGRMNELTCPSCENRVHHLGGKSEAWIKHSTWVQLFRSVQTLARLVT